MLTKVLKGFYDRKGTRYAIPTPEGDPIGQGYDDSELRDLIAAKADKNHTHTGYAAIDHTHDEDYASIDHVHSGLCPKVSGGTENNLCSLDNNGCIKDSGKKLSDLVGFYAEEETDDEHDYKGILVIYDNPTYFIANTTYLESFRPSSGGLITNVHNVAVASILTLRDENAAKGGGSEVTYTEIIGVVNLYSYVVSDVGGATVHRGIRFCIGEYIYTAEKTFNVSGGTVPSTYTVTRSSLPTNF